MFENRDFATIVVKIYDVKRKTKLVAPDTEYHTDGRVFRIKLSIYFIIRHDSGVVLFPSTSFRRHHSQSYLSFLVNYVQKPLLSKVRTKTCYYSLPQHKTRAYFRICCIRTSFFLHFLKKEHAKEQFYIYFNLVSNSSTTLLFFLPLFGQCRHKQL
jgi:hypothetical protein